MPEKPSKTNALRLAESAGLNFEAFEYDISDGRIDANSIAEKLGRSPEEVFKTLVAEAPGHEYFVFIVPAAGELDLKKAARACERKSIELIPLKKLLPLTGYVHGGCSPIGMKKQFKTAIHNAAEQYDTIMFSAGKIGYQVELPLASLQKVIPVQVADLIVEK